MKGSQYLPNNKSNQIIWLVNHYHPPIAHEAVLEKIETLLDIEIPIMKLKNTTNYRWKYRHFFSLPATNSSKLQSLGTIKIILSPDVTDYRTHRSINFILIFHVSNFKFNILGTPFIEKYVKTIKSSSHTQEIQHNYKTKFLEIFDSSTKSPPCYSRLFPVIGDHSLYFQFFENRILTYSLTAYDCKSKFPNGTLIPQSVFSFIPLRKNMFFSIMDKNSLDYPSQSFIQILIQNLWTTHCHLLNDKDDM